MLPATAMPITAPLEGPELLSLSSFWVLVGSASELELDICTTTVLVMITPFSSVETLSDTDRLVDDEEEEELELLLDELDEGIEVAESPGLSSRSRIPSKNWTYN